MALLSIDIGTTGTKAVLFSEIGEIIASAYQDYSYYYPRPGWVELEPEEVWDAVRKTVRQVSAGRQKMVKALCLSCTGNNIVPVRKDGTVIRRGIVAADTRNIEEIAIVRDAIGETSFFQIRGSRPRPMCGLCKILWLKRNEPDNFRQTWKFMTFSDFIRLRLGFPGIIDYSMASSSLPFDILRQKYSETLLKEFGLDRDMFSEPVSADQVLGELGLSVRTQLGLPKGVKFFTGGHDISCGILGAGITRKTLHVLADIAGTFEVVGCVRSEPNLDKQAFDSRINYYCNLRNDSYLAITSLPTCGSLMRWFHDELAVVERMKAEKEKTSAYEIMFEPLKFEGGKMIALPYFSGSAMDPYAKGALLGLTPDSQKQDMLQTMVEGVTHELKSLVDRVERSGRVPVELIRTIGGTSRAGKWLQLKADITGKTVESVQPEDASATGAAILAGVAAGVFSSIDQAINATVKIRAAYRPRPEIQEIYLRQHELYQRLIEALGPLNKELYYML